MNPRKEWNVGDEGQDLDWLNEINVISDGHYFATASKGKKTDEEHGGMGMPVHLKVDAQEPIFPVIVQDGRTVPLGDYQFARVNVGLSAVAPVQFHKQAWEWAEAWITEMIAREEASINKSGREEEPAPVPPDCIKMLVFRLEYGMTVKIGKGFAKIDVGASRPCVPETMDQEWGVLDKFVTDRIREKRKKLNKPPETATVAGGKKIKTKTGPKKLKKDMGL